MRGVIEMAFLASIFVGGLTYLLLLKILFVDFGEFFVRLRSSLWFFPVGAITDSVSDRESLRIWIWLPSGLVTGILFYHFAS